MKIYFWSAVFTGIVFTITTFNPIGSAIGATIMFAVMLYGASIMEKQEKRKNSEV